MSKSKKGGVFEREFARQLSLWWTEGKDRDVFWRSPNSGGFTTRLNQKGYNTKEIRTAGDIAAVKPEGDPFVSRVCVELKRGYGDSDLFKELYSTKSRLHKFLNQAKVQARENDVSQWWLVWKRDRKPALLFFPLVFFLDNPVYYFRGYSYKHFCLQVHNMVHGESSWAICVVLLDDFFTEAVPKND